MVTQVLMVPMVSTAMLMPVSSVMVTPVSVPVSVAAIMPHPGSMPVTTSVATAVGQLTCLTANGRTPQELIIEDWE